MWAASQTVSHSFPSATGAPTQGVAAAPRETALVHTY